MKKIKRKDTSPPKWLRWLISVIVIVLIVVAHIIVPSPPVIVVALQILADAFTTSYIFSLITWQ